MADKAQMTVPLSKMVAEIAEKHEMPKKKIAELFGDFMEDDVDIPERYAGRGANLVFRAEGDSMEGEFIADGDLLFVREEPDPRAARGKVVVAVVDGTPYVKRLDYGGNRIRLLSANDRYPPMDFDEQAIDWSLVGVVVGSCHEHR